ncbi:unnamed protein product [Gadus morhua 'NCC']
MAVKEEGKAGVTGLCLTSIKPCTPGSSADASISPGVLGSLCVQVGCWCVAVGDDSLTSLRRSQRKQPGYGRNWVTLRGVPENKTPKKTQKKKIVSVVVAALKHFSSSPHRSRRSVADIKERFACPRWGS